MPMITEKDLLNAIRECECEPLTASKIGKLADFYIIYDHLFGEPQYAEERPQTQIEKVIETTGDTEFLRAIDGKKADKVWRIIDELMDATKALHPRMYDKVIEKLYDL